MPPNSEFNYIFGSAIKAKVHQENKVSNRQSFHIPDVLEFRFYTFLKTQLIPLKFWFKIRKTSLNNTVST